MDINFQKALVNLMLTDPTLKTRLSDIPSSIVKTPTMQMIVELLQAYVKQYQALPMLPNLQELWRITVASGQRPIDPTMVKMVEDEMATCYEFRSYEPEQVRATVDGEITRTHLSKIMQSMAQPVSMSPATSMPDVYNELISQLARMGRTSEKVQTAGFLNSSPLPDPSTVKQIYPHHIASYNKIRTRGGFHALNSVVLVGDAKKFKTTLLVDTAVAYAAHMDVYYADTENGHVSINDRIRQRITGLTLNQLYDPSYAEYITNAVAGWFAGGGRIWVDKWKKGASTITDVKFRLEELKAKHGFAPKLIIYDYLDEFLPSTMTRELRHNIQAVYNEADALNDLLQTFYFTVSPKNRYGEVAEDYKKIYNCWSAFDLQQNEYEEEHNLIKVVSIAQREGTKGWFYIKVVPETQQVLAVSHEERLIIQEEMKALGLSEDINPRKSTGKPRR